MLGDKHASIREREHYIACRRCVSQCPWGTIALDDFGPSVLFAKLALLGETPEILYLTYHQEDNSENMQGRVLQIPCLQAIGKYSPQEILRIGFDGIAVNPCTDQKCVKYRKSIFICIEQWQAYFSAQFLEPQRIRFCKNSSEWLAFCKQIQQLGPNPYKNEKVFG